MNPYGTYQMPQMSPATAQAQMRLNQMEQMYPQFQGYNPQPQGMYGNMMQPNNAVLKGKPVTSLDEAKASTIDFDGSVFFFPDLANGKIYTKQINLDGTATLKEYSFVPVPAQQEAKPIAPQATDYGQMIGDLQQQVNELRAQVSTLSKGAKNVQRKSNADDANDE